MSAIPCVLCGKVLCFDLRLSVLICEISGKVSGDLWRFWHFWQSVSFVSIRVNSRLNSLRSLAAFAVKAFALDPRSSAQIRGKSFGP